MVDNAIRAQDLGKMYRIGRRATRYDTLRDAIVSGVRSSFDWLRRNNHTAERSNKFIWALKDVNFEVKRGEVLGVIGRNGAGKSTLLKILSRITEPTEGQAEINGRVGSLLEVGTGFHPELTGRENIYLNGAILGMRRADISRRFDDIVNFSGVGKFLDTPVKRFSSGMYVRLAFSVAAHLEPEILLVDEVLSVGDVAFQKRCMGKMDEVVSTGRTVVFVSHNMSAIQSLCPRTLLIDQGRLSFIGDTEEAVRRYLQAQVERQTVSFNQDTRRSGTGRARYLKASVLNDEGHPTGIIRMGEGFEVELHFEADRPMVNPSFGVVVRNTWGQSVAYLITRVTHGELPDVHQGGVIRLHVQRFDVMPGVYYLSLGISVPGEQIELIESALELEVAPAEVYPGGKLPPSGMAMLYVPCHWTHDYN